MVLQYTALGDSLTTGRGSGLFSAGFVQRFRDMMEADLKSKTAVSVFAKSGLDTEGILGLLSYPYVQKQIQAADMITITGCGNDLIESVLSYQSSQDETIFRRASAHCHENFEKMIAQIANIKGLDPSPYAIRVFNLYNPFPSIGIADQWITSFNSHLKTLASAPHVKIADVYSVFKGKEQEYLSFDGVHPNSNGYQAMAEVLQGIGYRELSVS
ncbi:GDSL-type esterase/lipase family protein [Bacillus halotolerans]|uniref:GDSL-type esterase/lipase family protein n=1 Tax=Bacillus halotolerans TaxID=260554 RepID=UPI0018F25BA3|nr:GDSL-type esterase/lipase family protein [Bacillus halotolerans]MBJ7573229.1 spore gernimation protein [Bacillus halotolerans]MDG3075277.1 GDSL-type esterase/lipase family protein [Bacillus halotolerans]MEC1407843.1 GDSL-type esterase/lipase family protein [Bacillus halotolerans]